MSPDLTFEQVRYFFGKFKNGAKQWLHLVNGLLSMRIGQKSGQLSVIAVPEFMLTVNQSAIDTTSAVLIWFGYLIRNHWSIENRLHWMLDVVFREDAATAYNDNSPLNMNVFKKVALARLRLTFAAKRSSLRRQSVKAALDVNFLHRVLFGV